MRQSTRRLVAASLVLAACSGPVSAPVTSAEPAPTTIPQTSAVAEAYLSEAVQIMKAHSLWSPLADWEAIEDAMRSRAQGAQSEKATFDAIEVGLRLLNDPRAVFVDSQTVFAFEAEAAEIEPPTVEILENRIGHVVSGQFIGDRGAEADDFSAGLASQIVEADAAVCGWILDLGITRFGIAEPVLGGVAPLLTRGEIGGYAKLGGEFDALENTGDRILVGGEVVASNSVTQSIDRKPVAVIVGALTGPPGELTAMAFRGQDDVEMFGQPSAGFGFWVDVFELPDGSVIALATGEPTDRLGNGLEGGFPLSPTNATDNPAMSKQTAIDWLTAHPACR